MSLYKEKDPIKLFSKWFEEANSAKIKNAEAMNLATATKDGIPSSRMVLLKDHSPEGFVFYTNLESKKGIDLQENPFVALCFYWKELGKQVRIEGKVEQVGAEEADIYFNSRPLQSRIGAHLSKQSHPLESSFDLLKEVATQSLKLSHAPRPKHWSGFRVKPNKIEFWQEGNFRIHDRLAFSLKNGEWKAERLYP